MKELLRGRLSKFKQVLYFSVLNSLRILSGISKNNCQKCKSSHRERIIQITDNADRRNAGYPCCHQHLRSIGDDSLDKTGKCVEDTGCFPTVEVELFSNIFSDGTGGDNGYGIVGRTKVGDTY